LHANVARVRTAVRAQEAGCEPAGPVSTVGTYSSSWSLLSNVRLATISRVTSGYPVVDAVAAGAPGDHGEDDHAETVHQACLEERPAQGQAAEVRIGLVLSCFIAA